MTLCWTSNKYLDYESKLDRTPLFFLSDQTYLTFTIIWINSLLFHFLSFFFGKWKWPKLLVLSRLGSIYLVLRRLLTVYRNCLLLVIERLPSYESRTIWAKRFYWFRKGDIFCSNACCWYLKKQQDSLQEARGKSFCFFVNKS